jgi:hypothetical protein
MDTGKDTSPVAVSLLDLLSHYHEASTMHPQARYHHLGDPSLHLRLVVLERSGQLESGLSSWVSGRTVCRQSPSACQRVVVSIEE